MLKYSINRTLKIRELVICWKLDIDIWKLITYVQKTQIK